MKIQKQERDGDREQKHTLQLKHWLTIIQLDLSNQVLDNAELFDLFDK